MGLCKQLASVRSTPFAPTAHENGLPACHASGAEYMLALCFRGLVPNVSSWLWPGGWGPML